MALGSMTGLEWIPKITYSDCGVETDFTLRIPMGRWYYRSFSKGGQDESDSGVQENFSTRHDRILVLKLRFTEEEWVEDVEPFFKVLFGEAQAWTLQLDKDDSGTEHTVYLVSPVTGEDVSPEWNPFDGVLELEIAVRTSDSTAFSYPYFPSLA